MSRGRCVPRRSWSWRVGTASSCPTADPTELYRYDSLDGFLRVFWLVQSTLMTRDDWARLAYESVIDGAVHGLVHRESFFTPARHLAGGQDLADIVAGLDEGFAAAEAETGVTCRLIADMDRAFGPAAGLELVERLAELRRSRCHRHRAGDRRRDGLDRARGRSGDVPPCLRCGSRSRLPAHGPPGRELAGQRRRRGNRRVGRATASTTASRSSAIRSSSRGWLRCEFP